MSAQVHAGEESGLGEVSQPPKKKSKMEAKAKPEVAPVPDMADRYRSDTAQIVGVPEGKLSDTAINMQSKFRKDVIVELDLSSNQYLTDINFVRGFPCLTNLNLSSCFNLGNNYKQASSLTRLKILNLSGTPLTELKHISEFKNLTSLYLRNNKLKETIKHLIPLTGLKTLSLRENQNITDLERLPELKSLTSLDLSRIMTYHDNTCEEPIYKSIDFLAGATSLVELNLSFNDFLQYIKPLTKIPTLAKLYLCGCDAVKDFENLRKIKNLKKLDLSYVDLTGGMISRLNDLGDHKHLKKLIIKKPIKLPNHIKLIEM